MHLTFNLYSIQAYNKLNVLSNYIPSIIQILSMSQGRKPEYKVLHSNRPKLEGYVEDHMARIAGELEAHNILTRDQHRNMTSDTDSRRGARNLLGIILRSVEDEEDSRTFVYFLNVLKNVGNTGLQTFAGKMEDDRKKFYKDLFPDVSGKMVLTSLFQSDFN